MLLAVAIHSRTLLVTLSFGLMPGQGFDSPILRLPLWSDLGYDHCRVRRRALSGHT